MHTKNLSQRLHSYDAPNEVERLYKQAMLDFLHQHPDAFLRSETIGHFTASAWILDKSGEKALMLHHKKLDRWFQLGGHADGDTDLLNVAIKEAQEESGIQGIEPVFASIFDLDIHEIPANSKDPQHFHYDVRFLLQVKSDEVIQINHEAKDLRWITKNRKDLPTQNVSVVRMFDKWVELNRNSIL